VSPAQPNLDIAGSQPNKPGSRRLGPRLDSEECILLLDIYLRHHADATQERARNRWVGGSALENGIALRPPACWRALAFKR